MRGLAAGTVALLGVMAQGAQAADMPFLRGALFDGPRRHVNWEGFYIGGQASYGTTDMNFTNATRGLADSAMTNTVLNSQMEVSDWPTLGKRPEHGHGYGGFAGYNWQWTDAVLGLEANYVHGKLRWVGLQRARSNHSLHDPFRFIVSLSPIIERMRRSRSTISARHAPARAGRSAASCPTCSVRWRWGRPTSSVQRVSGTNSIRERPD